MLDTPMINSNSLPIEVATSYANKNSTRGWLISGLVMVLILPLMPIFGLIGCGIQLLVVYLRSPKVPITLRTRVSVDDDYLYEKAYIEVLKARQVRATWRGIGLGALLLVAILSIVALSVYLFSGPWR